MYRTIDASFWTDPKIRLLDKTGRYLFFYLITNPHAHVSGIYYLPKVIQMHETGISPDRVWDRVWDRVSELEFAWFDDKNEVVFVRRMFRYQGSGDKHNRSASNQLQSLHKSFLIARFLKSYPEISTYLPATFEYPIDRVSKGHLSLAHREGEGPGTGEGPGKEGGGHPPALVLKTETVQLGEFGWVRLTAEQHQKLLAAVDGEFDYYIAKFDRWVNEAPDARSGTVKRRDRHAYESILNWSATDRKGQHGEHPRNGNSTSRTAAPGTGGGKLKARPYTPKQ